jgi:hypothetical protein
MNNTNVTVASTKDQSKLVRAKFGPGMLLQHEDLEQLNTYTRDLSRLMFRSFFGCGVVCGLVVSVKPDEKCDKLVVSVDQGLALNCAGDPVYVPKVQRLVFDPNCDPKKSCLLWVVLCGSTKNCAPRTAVCASDDDNATSACTRELDMFEIQVLSGDRPKCVCGCPDPKTQDEVRIGETECKCVKPYWPNDPGLNCYDSHYDGKCGCNCGDGSNCDCDCILLASLVYKPEPAPKWTVDHRVRRFVRPVLMRDPQVEAEENDRKKPQDVPPASPTYSEVEEIGTSTTGRITKTSSRLTKPGGSQTT